MLNLFLNIQNQSAAGNVIKLNKRKKKPTMHLNKKNKQTKQLLVQQNFTTAGTPVQAIPVIFCQFLCLFKGTH